MPALLYGHNFEWGRRGGYNMSMNWNMLLWFGVILVAFLLLKRIGLISLQKARTHLNSGATLVDVRSTAEFKAQRLPGAVNVPLNDLNAGARRHFPDKNKVLLLHCHSGTRSAMACRALKQMGYTKVFNVGSLARAQRIVDQ